MQSIDQGHRLGDLARALVRAVDPAEAEYFDVIYDGLQVGAARRGGPDRLRGFGVGEPLVLATPIVVTILTALSGTDSPPVGPPDAWVASRPRADAERVATVAEEHAVELGLDPHRAALLRTALAEKISAALAAKITRAE